MDKFDRIYQIHPRIGPHLFGPEFGQQAFVTSPPAGAPVLAFSTLTDDFSDNILDAAKWYTFTPTGSGSVVEQNQRLEPGQRIGR